MQKDFFGWDTPLLNDLIHLSNHDTSGIMDSRGYLKLLDVHGLVGKGQIARLVAVGCPDKADVNGESGLK